MSDEDKEEKTNEQQDGNQEDKKQYIPDELQNEVSKDINKQEQDTETHIKEQNEDNDSKNNENQNGDEDLSVIDKPKKHNIFKIISFTLFVMLLISIGYGVYGVFHMYTVKDKMQTFLQQSLDVARENAIENGANSTNLISTVRVVSIERYSPGLYRMTLKYYYPNGTEYYPNVEKVMYATDNLLFPKYYEMGGTIARDKNQKSL